MCAQQVFSKKEYKEVIRPDVELIKFFPKAPKFKNQKFWSPAQDANGMVIHDGFKMKWHNIGSGKVQLRLPVGIFTDAILCQAYVKINDKQEKRQLAKFKTHLQLIRMGRYTARGRLP